MSVSPLQLLRSGPPPPRVVLLPDAQFLVRAVPVTPGATVAEAAAQVELALEAVSPFPLSQLYYGWFWLPGAEQALVFAAYRRRFTAEQTAEWAGAELVLPAFAALLGLTGREPATTLLLAGADGVTAVHWAEGPVPAQVLHRPLDPEPTPEQRAALGERLVQELGGSRRVLTVDVVPVADAAESDGELAFRADDLVSRLPQACGAALDVRDKAELAGLRAARRRDLFLWRTAVGCVAALVLLGLGEIALVGGKVWQKGRAERVRVQKPTVDKIMSSQSLANRIEELATKRLLPFEMLNVLFEDNRKPAEITFLRVVTLPQTGIYTLTVDASASNAAQISVYEATLRNVPLLQKVEVRDLRTRGETATFTLAVTFKPDAVRPAEAIAP
jgi:hypothetical protein